MQKVLFEVAYMRVWPLRSRQQALVALFELTVNQLEHVKSAENDGAYDARDMLGRRQETRQALRRACAWTASEFWPRGNRLTRSRLCALVYSRRPFIPFPHELYHVQANNSSRLCGAG